MDITLDKKNATEASIKITLNEADYQPKVEEKIKDYSKKAQIKGFRPGKVPTGMIKKMYGKAIKVEEINHLLSHAVSDYIRDNKIKILGEPLPNVEEATNIDWESQKEFSFTYDVGLVSDFSYDLSDKVSVEGYEIEVEDKMLDETMDNLKNQFGKMSNPEETDKGDYIYGELKQKDGDFTHTAIVNIEDIKPRSQKKFIGVKKDETIEFEIDKVFKDDAALAQATGKTEEEAKELTGEFTLTVKNINRREPAELNQELFDKVFGKDTVKTEEEFRQKVKETVAENYNREAQVYTDRKIQETLLQSSNIELPDEFMKRWLKATNEKITDEDIAREYDLYTKQLRWDLLQNRIAEDNDIKVEHEDVMNKVKDMIRQQFASSGLLEQMEDNLEAFANNYIQGENGQNYMKVFNQVRTEKVMDVVKEKISLNKKKVTAEEFRNLLTEN